MALRIPAPVISRHYPGMRGQVLPVQSMSARRTILPSPSPSQPVSHSLALPLSHSVSLSFDLHISLARFSVDLSDDAAFFPLACSTLRGKRTLTPPAAAVDRDANHSIIVRPPGRKDRAGTTSDATARGSHPETRGVLAKADSAGSRERGWRVRFAMLYRTQNPPRAKKSKCGHARLNF